MVEGQSMTTVADVVAQVRDGRLEDFVREAVVLVARELMEGEICAEIGAELGEVAPEQRVDASQRVPGAGVGDEGRGARAVGPAQAVRAGVLPVVLGGRRPAEQAIVAVVMEAYVNGVTPGRSIGWSSSSGSRDDQGPCVGSVPRAGRACRGVPGAAAGGRLPVPVAGCEVRQGP